MALKLAWSMALLGASLATDGEFMASDDECGAESAEACTLNALQLRRQQVQQEEGCHDIKEGEGGPCWEAIMWIKNVGLPKHANWYPDMTEDSPLGALQFASWNTTHPKCPRPCNVPAPGSWCRNAAPPTLWRPAAAGPSINIKVQIHILTIWIFMFQGVFPQHFLCSPAPSGAMWLEIHPGALLQPLLVAFVQGGGWPGWQRRTFDPKHQSAPL